MKPPFILGVLVGYLLGSRAGRQRYEEIVAVARRVAGSQTVQATAGVVQAQVHEVAEQARRRLGNRPAADLSTVAAANGHRTT
ncbi:MAG: hypothetical protein ACR2N4_08605 [Jatrophihabitans sp.]